MNKNNNPIQLSIVAPVYQSEDYIEQFYLRARSSASKFTDDYEIILVDDCSTDGSLEILLSLQKKDERLIVIEHSRNFGQHKAIWTGLNYAHGEKIFVLDSDLEEEPEWIFEFNSVMNAQNVDVVFGVQNARKGVWIERFSGDVFYFFLKHALGMQCIRNIISARLMTRQYAQNLSQRNEQGFELTVVAYAIGFKHAIVPVTKHSISKSSYTWSKKFEFFERYVVSASVAPLRWIILFGAICFMVAIVIFILSIFYIITYNFILISIWLVSGVILISLGIIGFYIASIAEQVRSRPVTIVRNVWKDYNNESCSN